MRRRAEPLSRHEVDVSAVREAERRLTATEHSALDYRMWMESILNHAPMSVLLADRDGRYLVANRASVEQIGRPAEEILGGAPADLYESSIASEIERDHRRILQGGDPMTFEATRAHPGRSPDDPRDYLITRYPVLDVDGTICGVGTLSLDITDRRRAEANAARMAAIIASTDAAVVGMRIGGKIVSWNPAAERLYGYSAAEAVGANVSLLMPPELLGEYEANKIRINSGAGVGEIETVRRRKDGTDIDVAIALSPLLDSAGVVIGASTIARDITVQKATREQLRASEERLRTTIDHAPIGIALRAPDGRLLRVNRALCEMLGYSESELLALTPEKITHPDDVGLDSEQIRRMLADEIPSYDVEKRCLRADGAILLAQVSVSVARHGDGEPMHLVSHIQDITRRKQDEARLRMQASEQAALTEVATLVASEPNPRAVFALAAQRIAGLLDANYGIVVRLEHEVTARIVGAWSAEHLPTPELGGTLPLDGCTATATALRTGRTALVAGDALDPGAEVEARCGLSEPIEVNGQLWGVFSVGWEHESPPDPDAADRLARFARLASLAVTGAEAREQLSKLASTDHLTGLLNRRAFTDRLEQDIARARRHGRPLSLAVFDLDHFKLVNDTYGHPTGDRVLAEFAARLLDERRDGDIIARVGGEEFAWIMPDAAGAGAELCGERARRAIADTPFLGVGNLTISIGVCALDDADNGQQLFRQADLALYWAKTGGRNAVVRYSPENLERMTDDAHSSRLQDAKALTALRALAAAIDARDPATAGHSDRVAELAAGLARVAGWATAGIGQLRDAATVHDVGRLLTPEPAPLADHSTRTTQGRPAGAVAAAGAQMLAALLTPEQIDWIRHHQERFDGTGGPDGLAGADISEGARLLAVADAWVTMTGVGPGSRALTPADALADCERGAGTRFCPDAVIALAGLRRGAVSAPA
jgi:diguanylate cyclase (GGDEF)-like protein/PAS domain S-box-containing protein